MTPRGILAAVLLVLVWGSTAQAQTNSKIKALQKQKKEIQQGIDRSRKEIKSTQKKVDTKMRDINFMSNQIANRQRYIDTMEVHIKRMDDEVECLQRKVTETGRRLDKKKEEYARALRYARANRMVSSPLLFIISAKSVEQMYRRSRYANEYAQHQRRLAEGIVEEQRRLMAEKNDLLRLKDEKHKLMNECMEQKALIQKHQNEEERNVASLRKKQKKLEQEVNKQRQQLASLDKKIDQMIAYELEQARKRAEAARKKAEAEARRKAQQRKQADKSGRKTTAGSSSNKKTGGQIPDEYKWITPQDQVLNSDFVRNKGRLPVPITGSYMLGSRFGTYKVAGLKNVTLDNKGTNYVGKPGAMARSIFNGEVSTIFEFGGTRNVMVRHGSYISVYCNLSSVRVAKGQKVKARDILGTIEDDGSGNCVLHFQLHKEKTKLNPEVWIGR